MHSIPHFATPSPKIWDVPLARRLASLAEAKASGARVVAFVYEKHDATYFRYRCHNVARSLATGRDWRAGWFFRDEAAALERSLDRVDLVVVVRTRYTLELDQLAVRARARGIPFLFDIDDLVFDVQRIPQLLNTLGHGSPAEANYDYWFSTVSRYAMTASLADGFTATNALLGAALGRTFGKPWWVVRNTVSDEQVLVSDRCLRDKDPAHARGTFLIGYFSGSTTHEHDFGIAASELLPLFEEFPDVSLRVVGYLELPPELRRLAGTGRIEFFPLVHYLELQRLMAEVDVSIAPLQVNEFTECKSALKYFEAGLVKTVTVATPTREFAGRIRHGENGFLCAPGEWLPTLRTLRLGEVDLEAVAEAARRDVLALDHGEAVRKELEAVYGAAADLR